METNMEPWLIYEPLDSSNAEIRLLKLRRSEDGGVECNLTKCSLNENPEYFALSYAWGDLTVTKKILVNEKTFAATTNLVAALETIFRGVNSSRLLWVDAICINQGDIEERNTQVQMMKSIFKSAAMVLAWLGPEQDHSTEVIEIMKHISAEISSSDNADVEILSRLAPQGLLEKLSLETSDGSLISLALPRENDFYHLFRNRPFWKRAWVLQELVLAKHVVFICGRAAFTYADISVIASWQNSLPDPAMPVGVDWARWISFRYLIKESLSVPWTGYLLAATLDDVLRSEGPYFTAWMTFSSTWRLAATDPRDKVYSLLGLLDIGIEADYSKSPEMVYYEFATIMLERVPLDEWFQKAGISIESRIPGLPTWVIDWEALCKAGCGVSDFHGLYKSDFGMGELFKSTKINEQVLTISGILFDEIEVLASLFGECYLNAREAFKFDLTGGLPEEEVLHTLIPPGIPRGQASLRLCLDDRELSDKRRFVLKSSFRSLADDFLRLLRVGLAERSQGLAATYQSDPEAFTKIFLGDNAISSTFETEDTWRKQHYESSISGALAITFITHFEVYRHFYTRKGYLGYGPKGIQKGDLICVLQGCRVPVILRKVREHYNLVSTCLVLGLMDGEAAQMLKQGEVVMEQFDIH